MARITDCEKMAALLSRRIDEALSPAENQRIEAHLHACAHCRETEHLLSATRAHLRRHADATLHGSDLARRRTFTRFDAHLKVTRETVPTTRRLTYVRIAVAIIAAGVSLLVPLEPLDSPLPDSQEIRTLHALHETHAAALPGLPESATAEESSEQP